MREALPLLDEIRSRLEGVGDLIAMGWKPQQPKPPTWTVTYVKDGKSLYKKRGSWYIDDKKIGRLSDKRLLAKLKSMHERGPGQAFMDLPFELRVTEKEKPHGPPAPDDIQKTIARYYDDAMASLPDHIKSQPEKRQKAYAAAVAWTRFCKWKNPNHPSCEGVEFSEATEGEISALLKKHGLEGVNKPKLTPKHPTKKGVVLAKSGDKIKLIRFGAQGYKHNYSDEGRKAFKTRHAANIAKGVMSAAYWADKVLWSGPKGHKVTRESPKKKARHEETDYDRLVAKLKKKGVRDPKALAAYIGRKKLGKAEFQRRAAAGRRKAK